MFLHFFLDHFGHLSVGHKVYIFLPCLVILFLFNVLHFYRF